jgi:GntR family transcriptional repressor for pyruvate dehydrogenase complex
VGIVAPPRETVCEAVIEQIKSGVRSNRYTPGSRLPSERALAEQLGISRPTIREALRTLTVLGVVEARQGSGTQLSPSSANVLKSSFEFLMLLDQPTVYALYEARELIEVHLAGRAAEYRTANDLAVLEAILEEMRREISDPAAMTDPNVRFHQAIAAAAQNVVMERVMDCLHDGIRTCIEATRPATPDTAGSYERHVTIYDAIRRQNPADARRAMTIHMATAVEALRQWDRASSSPVSGV